MKKLKLWYQNIKPEIHFWLPLVVIVVALNFIFIGIATDEFAEMASKALNLCLG